MPQHSVRAVKRNLGVGTFDQACAPEGALIQRFQGGKITPPVSGSMPSRPTTPNPSQRPATK